jgi:membrane protein
MPPLSQIITRSKPYQRMAEVLDKVSLPGFHGASIYRVGKTLFREIRMNKLNIRGAAVTYNFLMAIPPSLLFFCSLVPYLPLKGVQESLLTIIRVLTPSETSYQTLSGVVVDFLNNERSGVLSFGLLFTFFFSSNGIMGLMRSFDRALPMYVKRGAVKRRWTALKLTFMVLVVTIFTIAALVIQTSYLNKLINEYIGYAGLIQGLTLFIIVLMIFFVICMVYTYGPSLTQRFPFLSSGAFFATIMCVLLTTVFFFLVKNVLHYNKVYGSIGTLMAFMVWLFLNTQVILLGYELNVSILLVRLDKNGDGIISPEELAEGI